MSSSRCVRSQAIYSRAASVILGHHDTSRLTWKKKHYISTIITAWLICFMIQCSGVFLFRDCFDCQFCMLWGISICTQISEQFYFLLIERGSPSLDSILLSRMQRLGLEGFLWLTSFLRFSAINSMPSSVIFEQPDKERMVRLGRECTAR